MAEKFPILEVAKASLAMPLQSPLNIFKAIGLVLVAGIVGGFLMAGLMIAMGADAASIAALPEAVEAGNLDDLGGLGGMLLGYLLLIFLVIGAVAHIFNYWVRFAAFGKDGAGLNGRAFSAAAVNGIKFLLIGILIVIVSLVVNFMVSALGLAPSIMEQAAIGGIVEQTKANFASNLITTIVACFVYSFFSANLTQTAMGDEEEALQHPHAIDFAVTLMLIYAVVIVPSILAALIGSAAMVWAVQLLLGIYVMFAVPAAHGLRYRICAKENASAAE